MVSDLIDPVEVSVDRVVLNINGWRIRGLSSSEFEDIGMTLWREKLRIVSQGDTYFKYCFRKDTGYSGVVRMRHDPGKKISGISANVTMNPIKHLRDQIDPDALVEPERSLDGNTNFISNDLMRKHGSLSKKRLLFEGLSVQIDYLLSLVEQSVSKTLSGKSDFDRLIKVSIEDIELVWDFECPNAILEVGRIDENFGSFFKDSSNCEYGPVRTTKGIIKNAPYLKAESGAGESIRIYAKTPDIIRFEALLNKKFIRRADGSNVLQGLSPRALQKICYRLAQEPALVMNNFLRNVRLNSKEWSLIELVHKMSRMCTRFEIFEEILQILVVKGGIKRSNKHAYTIDRMSKARILEKGCRGVWRISDENRELLRAFLTLVKQQK